MNVTIQEFEEHVAWSAFKYRIRSIAHLSPTDSAQFAFFLNGCRDMSEWLDAEIIASIPYWHAAKAMCAAARAIREEKEKGKEKEEKEKEETHMVAVADAIKFSPATPWDKTKGFAKPDYPVIDASVLSPPTTLWEQDPATWRHDCCLARKMRSDRDLRFDKSVGNHWQCGKPSIAGSNLCATCAVYKIKFETTEQCHPSWHGIMTDAPPPHTEVFYKDVYRYAHVRKVIPVFSHVERVKIKRGLSL